MAAGPAPMLVSKQPDGELGHPRNTTSSAPLNVPNRAQRAGPFACFRAQRLPAPDSVPVGFLTLGRPGLRQRGCISQGLRFAHAHLLLCGLHGEGSLPAPSALPRPAPPSMFQETPEVLRTLLRA
ncbi:hypothetical protein HJG60_009533 [Phyllostomus discolor]|uniref:Uncharacterized protein n=1 Tax=Phyllostomus discolor TaxID=89673 RepID=A0A834DCK4_9CHIR|nr:hypothetical protein HJG60_009533 [Phyllostomus discolor]